MSRLFDGMTPTDLASGCGPGPADQSVAGTLLVQDQLARPGNAQAIHLTVVLDQHFTVSLEEIVGRQRDRPGWSSRLPRRVLTSVVIIVIHFCTCAGLSIGESELLTAILLSDNTVKRLSLNIN